MAGASSAANEPLLGASYTINISNANLTPSLGYIVTPFAGKQAITFTDAAIGNNYALIQSASSSCVSHIIFGAAGQFNLTLDNIRMTQSDINAPTIMIYPGATVNFNVVGENEILNLAQSITGFESNNNSAIQVPMGASAVFSGTGSLTANGGSYSAAIGGGGGGYYGYLSLSPASGAIELGGSVRFLLTGGSNASALGGGFNGASGNITIKEDAYVKAWAGSAGSLNGPSGIGTGSAIENSFYTPSAGSIIIKGNARVDAYGADAINSANAGAAIGAGGGAGAGSISILDNARVEAAGGRNISDGAADAHNAPAIGSGSINSGQCAEIILAATASLKAYSKGVPSLISSAENSGTGFFINVSLDKGLDQDSEIRVFPSIFSDPDDFLALPAGFSSFAFITGSSSEPYALEAHASNAEPIGSLWFPSAGSWQISSAKSYQATPAVLASVLPFEPGSVEASEIMEDAAEISSSGFDLDIFTFVAGGFKYREISSDDWISVDWTPENGSTPRAVITNLIPNTKYEAVFFASASDGNFTSQKQSAPAQFTTLAKIASLTATAAPNSIYPYVSAEFTGGSEEITSVTINFSETDEYNIATAASVNASAEGFSDFLLSGGMDPGKTYNILVEASNASGISRKTTAYEAPLPDLGAVEVKDAAKSTAAFTVNGRNLKGVQLLDCGFRYSAALDLNGKMVDPIALPGASAIADGLQPNSKYCVSSFIEVQLANGGSLTLESAISTFFTYPEIKSASAKKSGSNSMPEVEAVFTEGSEDLENAFIYFSYEPIPEDLSGVASTAPLNFTSAGFPETRLNGLAAGRTCYIAVVVASTTGLSDRFDISYEVPAPIAGIMQAVESDDSSATLSSIGQDLKGFDLESCGFLYSTQLIDGKPGGEDLNVMYMDISNLGGPDGAVTASACGLKSNTRYYASYFASAGGYTAQSPIVSFTTAPKVLSASVEAGAHGMPRISAAFSGGTEQLASVSVFYSDSEIAIPGSPNISAGSFTPEGFSGVLVEGLTPGAEYNFAVFIQTFEGKSARFDIAWALPLPIAGTASAEEITKTGAKLSASNFDLKGYDFTDGGFAISKELDSQSPGGAFLQKISWTPYNGLSGVKTAYASGLESNTLYHIAAFAEVAGCAVQSSTCSFATMPEIISLSATYSDGGAPAINAVFSGGTEEITSVEIYYSTEELIIPGSAHSTVPSASRSGFTGFTLDGLIPGNSYNIAVVISSYAGTDTMYATINAPPEKAETTPSISEPPSNVSALTPSPTKPPSPSKVPASTPSPANAPPTTPTPSPLSVPPNVASSKSPTPTPPYASNSPSKTPAPLPSPSGTPSTGDSSQYGPPVPSNTMPPLPTPTPIRDNEIEIMPEATPSSATDLAQKTIGPFTLELPSEDIQVEISKENPPKPKDIDSQLKPISDASTFSWPSEDGSMAILAGISIPSNMVGAALAYSEDGSYRYIDISYDDGKASASLSPGETIQFFAAEIGKPLDMFIPAYVDKSFLSYQARVQNKSLEGYNGFVPNMYAMFGGNDSEGGSSSSANAKAYIDNPYDAKYPSAFDQRGRTYMPKVRDQLTTSLCWDFSTLSALELLIGKTSGLSYTLSVSNPAYRMSKSSSGFNRGPLDAGNFFISAAYLTAAGAVLDSDEPFDSLFNGKAGQDAAPVASVTDFEILRYDISNMKTYLMNYGSLISAVYVDDNKTSSFYNEETAAYYMASPQKNPNHMVQIIGWDNNYKASNFSSEPPLDGAWILKNSWGTQIGDGGFFYVSFADALLQKNLYAIKKASLTNPSDKLYMHDPYGQTGAISFNSKTSWASNTFKASGKSEKLKAVSFYTVNSNVNYEIYLSPTGKLNDRTLIKSGRAAAGYTTASLDKPIELNGQTFAVLVKMTSDTEVNIPVERDVPNYIAGASAELGQSYVGRDGATWIDLSEKLKNSNACIRAWTTTGEPAAAAKATAPAQAQTESKAAAKNSPEPQSSSSGNLSRGAAALLVAQAFGLNSQSAKSAMAALESKGTYDKISDKDPAVEITREEFCYALARVMDLPGTVGKSFLDISGSYAKKAIMALSSKKIIAADENGCFRPEEKVTLQDAKLWIENAKRK
jgi:C1A family cysteine protease